MYDIQKSNILCLTLNHTLHQRGVQQQQLIHKKEHWLRTPNCRRNMRHFCYHTKRMHRPLPYSENLNLFEFCRENGIVSLVPHGQSNCSSSPPSYYLVPGLFLMVQLGCSMTVYSEDHFRSACSLVYVQHS